MTMLVVDVLQTQRKSISHRLAPTMDDFYGGKERQEVDEIFSETCAWYHTLDMYPGEYVSFRNGMVLHGSAPVSAWREEEDEEEP